ncbi:hypothetical protein [Paenibacillus illinoisensis]|uniref:hypothetical protein n=1 Tax=Paenibacillus illinoisensis TaxID=59845 RepID=UPI003D2852F1
MANDESEQIKLAKQLNTISEKNKKQLAHISRIAGESSFNSMIQQASLSSRLHSQYSHMFKIPKGLSSIVQPTASGYAATMGINVKTFEKLGFTRGLPKQIQLPAFATIPNFKTWQINDISKLVNDHAFSSIINTAGSLKLYDNSAISIFKDNTLSSVAKSLSSVLSQFDAESLQNHIDSLPSSVTSEINKIEKELHDNSESHSKLKPFIEASEEFVSSELGAKVDFNKSNISLIGFLILLRIVFWYADLQGEQLLFPDSSDETLSVIKQSFEEDKRHNAVTEVIQEEQIELNREKSEEQKRHNITTEAIELQKLSEKMRHDIVVEEELQKLNTNKD